LATPIVERGAWEYAEDMPKAPKTPVSPTVSTVFSGFLKQLQDDGTADKVTVECLQNVFDEQEFDAESFREALFGPKDK
jgi:hypothetical protein